MTLEVIPIGGFSEIGRNCVAIKVDDEVVVCDLGLMLDKYIEYTEGLDNEKMEISGKKLIQIGAAPDAPGVQHGFGERTVLLERIIPDAPQQLRPGR